MKHKIRNFFIIILVLSITSCSGERLSIFKPKYIEYSPEILASLDMEKDGFEGRFGENKNNIFKINQTLVNSQKICRVVTLDYQKKTDRVRKVETYCKARGGTWK